MTSAWEILGLEGPTNDLKIIKRAYAKKLKTSRPDDDPEGFMALRDALEQAQFAASYEVSDHAIGGEDNLDVVDWVDHSPFTGAAPHSSEPPETQPSVFDDKNMLAEDSSSELTDAQQMLAEVQALLSDTFGKNETTRWKAIFDDPRLDGIDTAIDFEDLLRGYLLGEFGYYEGDGSRSNRKRSRPVISSRIGMLIFNKMGWRELEGRPLYVQDQINWLRVDLDVINRDSPREKVATDNEFADQYFQENDEENGFPIWGIAGILFAIYTVGKFLSNAYGNGMY